MSTTLEKATFPDLGKEQYIALTTFRKTGQAVTTPVIFAQSLGTIYVGTRADAFAEAGESRSPRVPTAAKPRDQ